MIFALLIYKTLLFRYKLCVLKPIKVFDLPSPLSVMCVISLALDEGSMSSLGLTEKAEEQPWVDTLLKFRLLALNSTGVCVCVYLVIHITAFAPRAWCSVPGQSGMWASPAEGSKGRCHGDAPVQQNSHGPGHTHVCSSSH